MITIITIKGYLITHIEYINTLYFEKGRYFVTLVNGRHFSKWEITSGSYKELRKRLYGEETQEKN